MARDIFSRTLDRVEWNSKLAGEDVAQEVAALKAQYEGDMAVGGADLASTFAQLDLIDEYRLTIHPVVLGAGTPFFPVLDQAINLQLVDSQTFGSGVVHLRYQRV